MELIKIESEFDNFIESVDGARVDEVVGKSPGFANADYIFHKDKIVAELKCLEDNKLKDKELNKAIIKVCEKWAKKGYKINYSKGDLRATVSNLPQGCSLDILKIYAKPIKKRIVKANKQIKETRKHLKCEDYQGVLLLANDGNLALDPEHIFHILSYILRGSFSGINAVIYFTVNYPGKANFTNVDTLVWSNSNRPNMTPVSDEFFDKLQSGWSEHLGKIIGSDIPSILLNSPSDLSGIVNKGHDITRKST